MNFVTSCAQTPAKG